MQWNAQRNKKLFPFIYKTLIWFLPMIEPKSFHFLCIVWGLCSIFFIQISKSMCAACISVTLHCIYGPKFTFFHSKEDNLTVSTKTYEHDYVEASLLLLYSTHCVYSTVCISNSNSHFAHCLPYIFNALNRLWCKKERIFVR